jgi:phosphate:Na+ symporter
MTLPLFFIQLAGATFLLLYAVRMVRTGVERASGPTLRRVLVGENRGRVLSAVSGIGISILLQSATATAILTVGFISSGLTNFVSGLAIILGADLGSAIVVQILTFKLDWLIPFLLAIGGWMYLTFSADQRGQIGRILLGVAFILISLGMISQASAPIRGSTLVPVVAGFLQKEIVTAFVLGVMFAFVMHSSVAAILLCVALAIENVISINVGVAIVLGANLGGALLPVWLTRSVERENRRVVFANVGIRGFGAVVGLLLLMTFPHLVENRTTPPGQTLVTVHLVFNGAVLLLGLCVLKASEKLMIRLLPDVSVPENGDSLLPRTALDQSVINMPNLALASITREVLRMGGMVQAMVIPSLDEFSNAHPSQQHNIDALEIEVNKAFDGIRRYTANMSQAEMSKKEAKQARELADFSINLEAAGDRVVKTLLPLAGEKLSKQLQFSDSGWSELTKLHTQVVSNIQLALNVLISEDIESARILIEGKNKLSRTIRSSRKRHLKRLSSGEEMSFDTSDIHLETLNALKDINSLFASVAYPILYRNNEMLETKLVDRDSV